MESKQSLFSFKSNCNLAKIGQLQAVRPMPLVCLVVKRRPIRISWHCQC